MAVLFIDSFDHYDTPEIGQKWDTGGGGAVMNLSGTRSRTGIGCIICSPFGPELNFAPVPGFVMGLAYNPTGANTNDIMGIISGTGVFRVRQVRLQVQSDGSLKALTGNDPSPTLLGQTVPNLIIPTIYSYVEMMVGSFGSAGTVTFRVNGLTVLTVTGNTDPDGTGTGKTIYIGGPGGGITAAIDDLYLCNLVAPNNTFLGAIRNYSQVPLSNGTPLQWTPLTGQNFQEVGEIPPDGDTSYVFSNHVGDVDQYQYGTSGIIPPVQIFAVQHVLDARIDISGTRLLASDVSGIVGPSTGLSTSYAMLKQPYDVNPATSNPWLLTDFSSIQFGPKVTG